MERPEYRSHYGDPEPFNKIVAVNRTLDGAIESAVSELVSRDALETLMTDELQWSEEVQDSLGEDLEFHIFVHRSRTDFDGIGFICGAESEDEPGTKYELRIEKMSMGR